MRSSSFALILIPTVILAACTTGAPDETSAPASSVESPAGDSGKAAMAAREHLAARLSANANDIAVESTEAREWSDSCLGLGGPAESCAAVITPGFAMVLVHDGTEYRYRTDETGMAVREE